VAVWATILSDTGIGLIAEDLVRGFDMFTQVGGPGGGGLGIGLALVRGIRLVAVTGWGHDTDRARAERAGFDAHLTKPADPDRLLASIVIAGRV
jgi:hypothetical protein